MQCMLLIGKDSVSMLGVETWREAVTWYAGKEEAVEVVVVIDVRVAVGLGLGEEMGEDE